MSQQELLRFLARTLAELGIDYFITGSWSSSLQGIPRATHDLDIVVALTPEQGERLIDFFPSERFYLSRPAVHQALHDRTMFNVLDTTSGDKIDFWMLTEEPWDQLRFERRERARLLGIATCVSTPEDTILAKLRWSMLSGGSEKQLGDARGVYEVQFGALDIAYVDHWAQQLGLMELWRHVQSAAD